MAKAIKFGGFFNSTPTPQTTRKIDYGKGERNVEKDSETELTELQKEFRAAAQKEEKLKEDNTNSEFFSVLVFKNHDQRNKFYELLNIKSDDLQYIDGQQLIKALQLQIQEVQLKNPGAFKCNAEILTLAM